MRVWLSEYLGVAFFKNADLENHLQKASRAMYLPRIKNKQGDTGRSAHHKCFKIKG